jgi:hypothetical protein
MSTTRLHHRLAPAALGLAVLAGILLPGPILAQDGEALQRYLEQTGEILQATADAVRETDSERARRVLQEAVHLHERSLDLAMDGHPQQAFQLSRRARTAAQHALRLAREAQGLEERARQRLERYREFRDQILDRARDSGDERVRRFIRESEDQARRANEQFNQGNYAMAINLIEPAEALLARAARLLFEGGGAERLERELERTRQLIDLTAERLAAQEDGGGQAAQDLLDSAREAFARAEEFFRRGEPLRCLHSLRLARRLASQAGEAVREAVNPEAVARQLERWDERYETVAERVADAGSAAARSMLERARHHRDRAEEQLASGEVEPALRQLRAAFDLLNEASELAR